MARERADALLPDRTRRRGSPERRAAREQEVRGGDPVHVRSGRARARVDAVYDEARSRGSDRSHGDQRRGAGFLRPGLHPGHRRARAEPVLGRVHVQGEHRGGRERKAGVPRRHRGAQALRRPASARRGLRHSRRAGRQIRARVRPGVLAADPARAQPGGPLRRARGDGADPGGVQVRRRR